MLQRDSVTREACIEWLFNLLWSTPSKQYTTRFLSNLPALHKETPELLIRISRSTRRTPAQCFPSEASLINALGKRNEEAKENNPSTQISHAMSAGPPCKDYQEKQIAAPPSHHRAASPNTMIVSSSSLTA